MRHQQLLALPLLILGAVVLLITALLAIPVPSARNLAGYRQTEYRFRDPHTPLSVGVPQDREASETGDQHPVTAPEDQNAQALPLSRREARERQRELREQLAPRGSDRLSDSSVEQEKK